jgi:Tol biopolymer transport system component
MKFPKLTLAYVLFGVGACAESPTQPPADTQIIASHTAYVEIENNRPVLYVDGPADAAPRRVHFTGDAEDIPGNNPLVPKLTDANILALRSPRWSPDGTQLALVASTAFDQAEVVVINADGSHPRIASVNYQYVMGDVDWAPNGKSLVYAMSTRAGAQGLELFISDLEQRTVRQLTQSSGYSGLGGVVRFDATGANVYFSKVTREQPTAPFNSISDVRRLSASGGAITNVATDIVGEVQAIERTGAGALVMRATSWPSDGNIPRELSRVSLAGSSPRTLAASTRLQTAHLTADDAFAVFLTETTGGTGFAYQTMPVAGGTPLMLRNVNNGSGGMDARIIRQ